VKLAGEQGAVARFLMTVEMRKCSPYTLRQYRYALTLMVSLLESLCQVTELEQVTVFHLRQCVQHLLAAPVDRQKSRRPPENGETLSTSSIGTYERTWKAFFNWCLKEELIGKNPALRLEFPRVEEKLVPAFSDNQAQKMLDSFDLSTEEGFRDYLILLLLIDTGLRRSEVARLHVEDVQLDYIRVQGKGRKERRVGISPELSMLLWKYIHKYRHPRKPDEPVLFLSTGNRSAGLPFGRGGMNGLMARLKRITGIDDVRLSPHTFRHTFARMYLEEGGDLFSLSREMGHSDVKTTQRYLRSFTSDNARKHHNEFSPLRRLKVRTSRKGKEKRKK